MRKRACADPRSAHSEIVPCGSHVRSSDAPASMAIQACGCPHRHPARSGQSESLLSISDAADSALTADRPGRRSDLGRRPPPATVRWSAGKPRGGAMQLRVVGAGLGRTGTESLKTALEQLTGGPCYHMYEVFDHPDAVPLWHAVVRGESDDWDALMAGYTASVDWPAVAYWPELLAANPEAIVLLSSR